MKYVPKPLKHTADISRSRATVGAWVRDAISVAVVLVAIYFLLGALADFAAHRIPESWEAKMATRDYLNNEKFSFIEESTRADEIFDKLIRSDRLRPLPYHMKVIDQDSPNAFALPGGTILLTSGLLDSVKSEIGLATVIGHELGHHQHRHTLKGLGRGILYSLAMGLMFGSTHTGGTDDLLNFGLSQYSQKHEFQADEFGLKLVHQTYGTTEGSLEFFQMIQNEGYDDRSRWKSLFESHPLTPDRIKRLKEISNSL